MPELILQITYRYTAIEAPDSKAMSKHVWVDTTPVLARPILAFDLLQASPSGYVIDDILDLPGSNVAIAVAREQSALTNQKL